MGVEGFEPTIGIASGFTVQRNTPTLPHTHDGGAVPQLAVTRYPQPEPVLGQASFRFVLSILTCSYMRMVRICGGPIRVRSENLPLAKRVLSQLSYRPMCSNT